MELSIPYTANQPLLSRRHGLELLVLRVSVRLCVWCVQVFEDALFYRVERDPGTGIFVKANGRVRAHDVAESVMRTIFFVCHTTAEDMARGRQKRVVVYPRLHDRFSASLLFGRRVSGS